MIRAVTHKLVPQRRVEQSHGPWAADVVAMVGSVVTLRVATTGDTTTVVAVSLSVSSILLPIIQPSKLMQGLLLVVLLLLVVVVVSLHDMT